VIQKRKITAFPEAGEADYSHLQPIVDFLIEKGNKSVNKYLWGNNRTGYFCHLNDPIDFDELETVFELPESIKWNEKNQSIDCYNTYSLIKGDNKSKGQTP
jgi:hypothetical protein